MICLFRAGWLAGGLLVLLPVLLLLLLVVVAVVLRFILITGVINIIKERCFPSRPLQEQVLSLETII